MTTVRLHYGLWISRSWMVVCLFAPSCELLNQQLLFTLNRSNDDDEATKVFSALDTTSHRCDPILVNFFAGVCRSNDVFHRPSIWQRRTCCGFCFTQRGVIRIIFKGRGCWGWPITYEHDRTSGKRSSVGRGRPWASAVVVTTSTPTWFYQSHKNDNNYCCCCRRTVDRSGGLDGGSAIIGRFDQCGLGRYKHCLDNDYCFVSNQKRQPTNSLETSSRLQ